MRRLIPLLMILFSFSSFAKRLCFVGDTGTAEKGQFLVAMAMWKEKCNAVFHLGDIIYEKGLTDESDNQLKTKFLIPYADLLKYIPFYISLGNHDYYGDENAWIGIAKKYSNIIFPDFYYSAYFDGVCISAIDALHRGAKQALFIKEQAKRAGCRYRVAFGHYPIISSGEHGNTWWAAGAFLRFNVIGKFDYYISGHDHQLSDEGLVGTTRQLISGAGAKLRKIEGKPKWGASVLGFLVLDTQVDRFYFVNSANKELYSFPAK